MGNTISFNFVSSTLYSVGYFLCFIMPRPFKFEKNEVKLQLLPQKGKNGITFEICIENCNINVTIHINKAKVTKLCWSIFSTPMCKSFRTTVSISYIYIYRERERKV